MQKIENLNEAFFEQVKKQKHGERTRVLFDMLMEHLKAPHDITSRGFWELMKESLKGENDAQGELMKMTQNKPKRGRVSSSN